VEFFAGPGLGDRALLGLVNLTVLSRCAFFPPGTPLFSTDGASSGRHCPASGEGGRVPPTNALRLGGPKKTTGRCFLPHPARLPFISCFGARGSSNGRFGPRHSYRPPEPHLPPVPRPYRIGPAALEGAPNEGAADRGPGSFALFPCPFAFLGQVLYTRKGLILLLVKPWVFTRSSGSKRRDLPLPPPSSPGPCGVPGALYALAVFLPSPSFSAWSFLLGLLLVNVRVPVFGLAVPGGDSPPPGRHFPLSFVLFTGGRFGFSTKRGGGEMVPIGPRGRALTEMKMRTGREPWPTPRVQGTCMTSRSTDSGSRRCGFLPVLACSIFLTVGPGPWQNWGSSFARTIAISRKNGCFWGDPLLSPVLRGHQGRPPPQISPGTTGSSVGRVRSPMCPVSTPLVDQPNGGGPLTAFAFRCGVPVGRFFRRLGIGKRPRERVPSARYPPSKAGTMKRPESYGPGGPPPTTSPANSGLPHRAVGCPTLEEGRRFAFTPPCPFEGRLPLQPGFLLRKRGQKNHPQGLPHPQGPLLPPAFAGPSCKRSGRYDLV